MTSNVHRSTARRASRGLAAALVVALPLVGSPAFADAPEQWEDTSVPGLEALLILVGGPVALFAVIALLTYLPSLVRGQKYDSALAWREEPEWFGGPRTGVPDDADTEAAATTGDKGGASAHW